jgi:hypothetical protein
MEEEVRYQIIFSGTISEEYDLITTKKRFAKFFKLNLKKTERLFTGKDHVLKTNISEAEAMKFAIAMANIGCECYMESLPHDDDISHQPGFVERRVSSERRISRPRRKTLRTASINPDRRKIHRQRKTDNPQD